MAEYKNSFDMGVQETAALGVKLHEQVQASLDQHRERVVNEVKRNNEAKFSLLEQKSRIGIKSIVKGLEETCNNMKSNVAVIRSVVAKNEFTCNQINKSVTSLGTKLTSLEEHVLSKVDNDNQDDASSYVSPPEDDDDDDESMDSDKEGNSEVNPNDGRKRKKRKTSKKTKITKKKRKNRNDDDDDDDDDRAVAPTRSTRSTVQNNNKNKKKKKRRCAATTTTTTSASGCIHSRWKSIQDEVRKQMEQQLILGPPFPTLPINTDDEKLRLMGAYKRKQRNSYQVMIRFHKKDQYLGNWKRPEQAAQACRYAKELIDDGNGDGDGEGNNDNNNGNDTIHNKKKRRRCK